MAATHILVLLLAFLSPCLSTGAKISPLRVVKGVRMELALREDHTSCKTAAADSPLDKTRHRVVCSIKRSSERAAKLQSHIGGAMLDAEYESPLASGGGDYVTTITIGTPPKTYQVIADTGSDLVWVQCKPCDQCFDQVDPLFDPRSSSTYETRGCSDAMCDALPRKSCSGTSSCAYTYGYGDGSGSRGSLASETVTLAATDGATTLARHVAFGCGHRNNGKFTGAAGLIGLGRGDLSFVSQLGSRFGNRFSYCLVPWSDSPNVTSPLIFGDGDNSDADGDDLRRFRYTPMVRNPTMPTFYYVKLYDISVGGRKLGIPSGTFDIQADGKGGIIFDSGTTLTLLQSAAYAKLVSSLRSRIRLPRVDGSSIGLDVCYDVSSAGPKFKSRMPSITFHFDGADQKLPLENYFIPVNDAHTIVCLAMSGSDMDIGIIGNLQQQNFKVTYDVDRERIGWSPANCEEN